MAENSSYPCPNCQIGLCQPTRTSYLRLVNGGLVCAQGQRGWVCDVCRYQEFDGDVVRNMDILLGLREPSVQRATPRVRGKSTEY